MLKHEIAKPDTFLYFSYGANMFTFRIHMKCRTAEFVSIARVDNYRLDFHKYAKFWGGPTATLVPTANAHVWGTIWRMHTDEKTVLDSLKRVDVKRYYVKYIDVLTPYMGQFHCRAYIQKINPLPRGDHDVIPVERWPSWTYRELMIMGATDHGLPEYYIDYIKSLKHNSEQGCFLMECLLNRFAEEEPCECRVPGRIPRKPLKLDLNKLRGEKESEVFKYPYDYGQ